MLHIRNFLPLVLAALFIVSCGDDDKNRPTDTTTSGSITIAVDETFQPIIQEQLRVFDSSFPEAHITARYKPENEVIESFLNDSVRLILATRDLSADEKAFLEQKKVLTASMAIAKDAIAIVLNHSSPDSMLSIAQLKGILTGTYSKKYTVVFDNQGSSTVRYMLDSLTPGQKLGANVFAAKGNDSVIAYVANNPDAIGFVGVSYVSDFADPAGLAFINTVTVAQVFNEKLQKFYGPYQAYIAPNWYPLTRSLYYIHREMYPGLGTGFANFLSRERGQLIFKQARLFPLRTNIIFRDATVNP